MMKHLAWNCGENNNSPCVPRGSFVQFSYIEGGRRLGKSAKSLKKWWLRPDLNRGPHHYEYDEAF